jgi:hypothetical protein
MRGDVECVRYLHERGVKLWERAWEAGEWYHRRVRHEDLRAREIRENMCVHKRLLPIYWTPKRADRMWAAVRYGAYMGAPLSPAAYAVFRVKRAATRAVLLCFHVAGRLIRETRIGRKRAAWAGMGRVPPELIEKVLIHADLEIPESIRRGLPVQCSVRVQMTHRCFEKETIYAHATSGEISQERTLLTMC